MQVTGVLVNLKAYDYIKSETNESKFGGEVSVIPESENSYNSPLVRGVFPITFRLPTDNREQYNFILSKFPESLPGYPALLRCQVIYTEKPTNTGSIKMLLDIKLQEQK